MISNSTTFNLIKVATFADIPATFLESTCYYTIDTEKYYIYKDQLIQEIFIPGIIDITHADLVTAKNSGSLYPGTRYRITDFQTIYDRPDYQTEYSLSSTIETIYADIDPIIVQAGSESELELTAFQESKPLDRLKYILEFTTPINGIETKGRIIERTDEFENTTDFDYPVVLFKRYYVPNGFPNPNYTFNYISYFDWSNQVTVEHQYDIETDTPSLADGNAPISNDFKEFVCITAGTRNFGSGDITVSIGDWLVYYNNVWNRVSNSTLFPVFNNMFGTYNNNFGGAYLNYINGEVELDLPNIIFKSGAVYDNTVDFIYNSTFDSTTFNNNNIGTLRGVLSLGDFYGNESNKIQYSSFGEFIENRIDIVYGVETHLDIDSCSGSELSQITVPIDMFKVNFNTISGLYSSTIQTDPNWNYYRVSIALCDINSMYSCTFEKPSQTFSLTSSNISSLSNVSFIGAAAIDKCQISTMDYCEIHNEISYCNLTRVFGSKFYGTALRIIVHGEITDCEFGLNFGDNLELNDAFGPGIKAEEISGNVFYGSIDECKFGANVSGNTFRSNLKGTTVPSYCVNNDFVCMPKGGSSSLFLRPELTSSIRTVITTAKYDLQVSSLNNNQFDFVIFTTLDENGDTVFYFKSDHGAIDPKPFFADLTAQTTAHPQAVDATALGYGIGNTEVGGYIIDKWNENGALSSIYRDPFITRNSFVPSRDELLEVYTNRVALGITTTEIIWSSSELNATHAYAVDFSDGSVLIQLKSEEYRTIPIYHVTNYDRLVIKYMDSSGSEIVKAFV
jgi:hypothetical protein